MAYWKNGRWPLSESDIRAENPDTMFGDTLTPAQAAAFGYLEIVPAEPPSLIPDYCERVDAEPVLVDGVYRQQVEFVDWPLDEAKAAHWARVKSERDRLEASGFMYGGHLMDSDERAVQRITAAVQAAQKALAEGWPFSITWTCKDGYLMPLDAAGMTNMPVALAARANALHVHAKTLKDAIAAAETVDDVRALSVSSGWPDL